MTQNQYVVRRKLNIPELGETPGNISEACRKSGVSRQPHCDIKTAVEEEGLEGLPEKSRKAPRLRNLAAPEIERKVLDYSLEFPARGQKRAANELKKQGIQISDGGIRSVWLRRNLQIARLRLKRLEKWSAENGGLRTTIWRFGKVLAGFSYYLTELRAFGLYSSIFFVPAFTGKGRYELQHGLFP